MLAAAGMAIAAIGLVRLVVRDASPNARMATSIGVCIAATGLAWVVIPGSQSIAAGMGSLIVALSTDLLTRIPCRFLCRPALVSAALALGGVALAGGSFHRFALAETAALDADTLLVEKILSQPLLRDSGRRDVTTDAGHVVALLESSEGRSPDLIDRADREIVGGMRLAGRVERLAPAGDACNCHGWAFTGGRYWIANHDLDFILEDNCYQVVSDPRPGDLAMYKQGNAFTHTAVVVAAEPGEPVMVVGKWGWMGVYRHAVYDCAYGRDVAYYRSSRRGHVLQGLSEPGQ